MSKLSVVDLVYVGETIHSGHVPHTVKRKNVTGVEVNVLELKEVQVERGPHRKKVTMYDPDQQRDRVIRIEFSKESDGRYYARGIPMVAAQRIVKSSKQYRIVKNSEGLPEDKLTIRFTEDVKVFGRTVKADTEKTYNRDYAQGFVDEGKAEVVA